MIIMKFGGTSLRDANAFKNVISIIKNSLKKKPIIVVSAIAGVTSLLEKAIEVAANQERVALDKIIALILSQHIEVINELFSEGDLKTRLSKSIYTESEKLKILLGAMETIKSEQNQLKHAILSAGEILSSLILTNLCIQNSIESQFVDAKKIMITSNKKNTVVPKPDLIREKSNRVLVPLVTKAVIPITQGFVGATKSGSPTTLGRNGSDYSASLLGAALNVDEIQIWTDVDGILTADPSIIPSAKLLKTMTFNEASELAYFGARVLYPAAIQPAKKKGIPVRVLNSHFTQSSGTLIVDKPKDKSDPAIKSIAYKEGITLLTIKSSQLLLSTKLLAKFFKFLNKSTIPVYAISKSATKLSLTIENGKNQRNIVKTFNTFGETFVENKKAIVSIVGENLKGNQDISWQVIKLLKDNKVKIDLISQFSSQISFMFIIAEKDIEKTVKLIHEKYIEKTGYV